MNRSEKLGHGSHRAMKHLVLRNTVGAFVIRGLAAVAVLGMNVVLARALSLPDYGVVALGLAWLTVAGAIACFGTDKVTLRFVAEGLAKSDTIQVSHIIRWGGKLTIAAGILTALISIAALTLLFSQYTAAQRLALGLVVAATPLLAFTLNRVGALRGAKRVILAATVEMLLRPLAVLIIAFGLLLAIGSPIGVVSAALIVLLAQAIPATLGLLRSRDLVTDLVPIEQTSKREWMRVATPIAVMNIMGVLISNTDTIAVGYFLDAGSAGIYRASAQLANLVAFGLIASNGIVAPLIAELYSSDRIEQLRRMLRFSVALVSLGSVICIAAMAVFGKTMLGFFGPEYQAGYQALLILLIGQTVNALCGPTGFMMSMTGHQNQAMRMFAVSTAINITLNLVLIPRFGLIGGAIANVTGVSCWNFAILLYLRLKLKLDPSIFSWLNNSQTNIEIEHK